MVIPKNSKDVAAIRGMLSAVRTQVNSAATAFSDPLKNIFAELTKKFDSALASLPTSETQCDWSLENQLENFFASLVQASSLASMCALEVNQLKADAAKNMASAVTAELEKKLTAGEYVLRASLDTEIGKAIKGKTDSGELVTKEMHAQLCSAAKTAGVTEGQTQERAKITEAEQRNALIASRTESLTKAGFALPPADLRKVLGEPEEVYAAAKAKAESRAGKLKADGFQINSDLAENVWLDDANFGRFEKVISATPSLKIKPEPFAGGAGGGESAQFMV